MNIRCQEVRAGLIPSQRVVIVATADGRTEEIHLSADLVSDGDLLEVGVVHRQLDRALVEFPVESAAGNWRAWIAAEDLVEQTAERAG